jgi:Skp family chaperone for outer membrane proteins
MTTRSLSLRGARLGLLVFLLAAGQAFAQSPPPGAPTGAGRPLAPNAPTAPAPGRSFTPAPSSSQSAPLLPPLTQPAPPSPTAAPAPRGGTQIQQAAPQMPPPPPPGKLPAPSIAVIDFGIILQNSAAAKSVREQIDKQSQAYQAEFNKRETDLRNTEQDLVRQRSVLSPDAFADKRRQLESQVADFQRQTNSRKDQLQQAFDGGMREVQNNVAQILAQVKVERSVNLIFQANALASNDDNLDLTSEVLKRLDQKLPRVAVKLPPLK